MSKISVTPLYKDYLIDDIQSSYAILHVDHNGNIYIEHMDKYYIVSLDNVCKTGIELTVMVNVERFRNNLVEFKKNIKTYKYKKILLDLHSKTIEKFNELDESEKCDFNELNDNHHHDPNHIEKKYYKIDKKINGNSDEEDIDDLEDLDDVDDLDDFYLCGNFENGMKISDMLSLYNCSFETILIEGENNVLASTEKVSHNCCQRLTIYTNGKTRVNFIDKVCIGKIMYDGKTLFIE